MTQQEARKQIETCEDQITYTYDQLISCAKILGQKGYKTAETTKAEMEKEASEKKIKILVFLMFSIPVCMIFFAASIYVGILCICLDVVVAFALLMSVVNKEGEMEYSAHQELAKLETQLVNFNEILDNNQKT